MKILGMGVYNIAEAAKLSGLQPGRVRAWFRPGETNLSSRPVFLSDYPSVGDDRAISFLDLIEVCIAGKLRAADPPVSLQHIRKVHRKLSNDTGQKHPFCTREIYHSRGKIFTRPLNEPGTDAIIDPLSNQQYINAIILPFLQRIEYDEITDLARLWHIADGIVVDPARCFGKPIVEEVGIATRILASAYEANGRNSRRVANWYEIDPDHVEKAVKFERELAA
jgi:uncharacterized protein (DUF433 family)